MKKGIIIIFILALIAVQVSGCAGDHEENGLPSEPENSPAAAAVSEMPDPEERDTPEPPEREEAGEALPESEEAGELPADGEEEGPGDADTAAELTKLPYSVDYHRMSPFLEDKYDEETVQAAHEVIDAFLRNETSVEVPAMHRYQQENVHSLVRTLCPAFTAFCEVEYETPPGSPDTSTAFSWSYRMPQEEMERKTAAFEAAVESYMADVYEEDTEAMKALCIYYAYSRELTYDYTLLDRESSGLSPDELGYRTSPFCALTDHMGTCGDISEGLAFLFQLAGINAAPVGSYEGAGAHEWTMAEIDGKYYYFDATWDINDGETDSLMYFGMSEEDRAGWAGGYPADSVQYACSYDIHGNYDLSDARFSPINGEQARNVYAFEADHAEQKVRISTDCGVLTLDMNDGT